MNPIAFVDTAIWIAAINPREPSHRSIREVLQSGESRLLTTELVIVETLNYFSARGQNLRNLASSAVANVMAETFCKVLPLSDTPLIAALNLYRSREDKEWSLTDCASMIAMRIHEIDRILTFDRHFAQAGFLVLPEFRP